MSFDDHFESSRVSSDADGDAEATRDSPATEDSSKDERSTQDILRQAADGDLRRAMRDGIERFEGIEFYEVHIEADTATLGPVTFVSDPRSPREAIDLAVAIEARHDDLENVAVVDMFSGTHVIPDVRSLRLNAELEQRIAA